MIQIFLDLTMGASFLILKYLTLSNSVHQTTVLRATDNFIKSSMKTINVVRVECALKIFPGLPRSSEYLLWSQQLGLLMVYFLLSVLKFNVFYHWFFLPFYKYFVLRWIYSLSVKKVYTVYCYGLWQQRGWAKACIIVLLMMCGPSAFSFFTTCPSSLDSFFWKLVENDKWMGSNNSGMNSFVWGLIWGVYTSPGYCKNSLK